MIIIKKIFILCLYMEYILVLDINYKLCFIYRIIYSYIKENMMCQNSNGRFNNRIKFKFNQEIYIKTIRCKIIRFQKFMWRNMMRSTKNQKGSVLHYSIDNNNNNNNNKFKKKMLKI